jgi:hypothetical protein
MKHLRWLLPVLLVVTISAAPTLPQQGGAAISSLLKAATDRGDVPGVVVAVVNKDGVLYNEAFGKSRTSTSTTTRSRSTCRIGRTGRSSVGSTTRTPATRRDRRNARSPSGTC